MKDANAMTKDANGSESRANNDSDVKTRAVSKVTSPVSRAWTEKTAKVRTGANTFVT
jgi:hypothetical protein